jgi:hypothetical protein
MTWFRYLPSTANPSESNQDENYIYPILKREISIDLFNQDIQKDSWIFVDVSGLNIDDFIDTSLLTQSEMNSYLVVYESKAADDYNFIPVKSHIIDNILFFQTAEFHQKNIKLEKQYSLYYKTKNLKYIKKVQNGEFLDYISCSEQESEFATEESDVDQTSFDVYPSSEEAYGFSFGNLDVDWKNGVSLIPGAKAIGLFTGPFFELYCDKGPDFGKLELRIVSFADEDNPSPITELDWTVIDLFSSELQSSELIFSKNDLLYKKYMFEIKSNFEKNELASEGKVSIKYYSYSYDAKCKLLEEKITPYIFGRIISGGNLNG